MKNKILIIVLIIILIFTSFVLSCYGENSDGLNWYVKRCGNKRPQISDNQKVIEKYNGFYIDNKLSDDSEKKILYLTFDAGYENGNVEKIVNILKEKDVPAAFFLLDHIIIKNTDLVMRMVNEGHIVCNHTRNHKDLTTCSREENINNLVGLEKVYKDRTGLEISKYFRFPEGRYNEESLALVNELGYKTIFWSFGYDDWDDNRQPNPEKAKEKILTNTHNGAVILLHPTSSTNAKILPGLIDAWREMGYSFGTLDELVM